MADEVQTNFVASAAAALLLLRGSLVPGVRPLNLGGVVVQDLKVSHVFGEEGGRECGSAIW